MAKLLKLGVYIVTMLFVCSTFADDQQVPLTKLGSKNRPTLKFFYCYSCGYRKLFEDYVNMIRKNYPILQVDGENFNPPGYNMHIATALRFAKYLLILLIVCGVEFGGRPMPSIWQWCVENRMYSCIMIFFIGNAIEMQLISSGAFEIHFNDVPVWSKLETGRIPQPPELFDIIDAQLRMQFSFANWRSSNDLDFLCTVRDYLQLKRLCRKPKTKLGDRLRIAGNAMSWLDRREWGKDCRHLPLFDGTAGQSPRKDRIRWSVNATDVVMLNLNNNNNNNNNNSNNADNNTNKWLVPCNAKPVITDWIPYSAFHFLVTIVVFYKSERILASPFDARVLCVHRFWHMFSAKVSRIGKLSNAYSMSIYFII